MKSNSADTHTQPSSTDAPLVFVIEALTLGGAEHMLIAMANRFVERGYPVHVVCLSQWGEMVDDLDARVVRHLLKKRPRIDPRLPGKLRRLMKSIEPAAVSTHLFTANFWTRLALISTGIRVVVTEHSRDDWKSWVYRTLDRVFIHFCYRLVAVSEDTARFYREDVGLDKDKVMVINNGIETLEFASGDGRELRNEWLDQYAPESLRESCVFVGIVGRLVEAKNHQRLLDAAARWVTTAPHIRTLIIGDGELRDSIDGGIQERNLGEHVFRLGSRNDIPVILAALDIFVLCSDREGHPLTALEAQAAGTPVVLTRAGGCEDALAVQGERTGGILVEKDTEEFTSAVAELAKDKARRIEMGTLCRSLRLGALRSGTHDRWLH